jgi:stage II sporulation protein M
MFEMLINPKKAERKPWEMLFVGMFYSSVAVLLVNWIFGSDPVLSKSAGILIVTFTVMFSLPFVYFILRLEENKSEETFGTINLIKVHRRALYAFLWLFLGFVIGFAFWYIMLPTTTSFKTQIETYCAINRPGNFEECVVQYGVKNVQGTVFVTNAERLFLIFSNNIYVLIFTILFSLIFGAGVIFILAWNASVIAAAIGVFSQSKLSALPMGLARYIIHGLPEIAAYFTAAMGGGIISIAIIKHEIGTDKFWRILRDSLNLVIISVIILFLAAFMEVFVTPLFFS